MEKKKGISFIILIIYLVITFACFITFITLDLMRNFKHVIDIKFSLIVLNFLVGIVFLIFNFKNEKIFIIIGLFFTIFADYLLGYKSNYDNFLSLGVIIFSLVQILYFCYICHIIRNLKGIILRIIVRLLVIGIVNLVLYFAFPFYSELVNHLAASYFILILFNCYDFLHLGVKKNKKYLLLSLGFFLFLLCDLMVGLNFLFDSFIYYFLIWVFYIPSQSLIMSSIFYLE